MLLYWPCKSYTLIEIGAKREATGCKQEYGVTADGKSFTLGMSIVSKAAMVSRAEHQKHGSALQQQLAKACG
jgi:hypothetical protein